MNRCSAPPLIATLLLLATAFAPTARGQTSNEDLRREIEALKKGQQEILQQLAEIKRQLQARPPAAAPAVGPDVRDRVFDLGANPVRGEPTARLTLVELTDYQ